MFRINKRYNKQKRTIPFAECRYSSEVLRICYKLGDVDSAIEFLTSPDFKGLFDQHTSFRIVMTMLFNDGRYGDILKLYENYLTRPFKEKYPKIMSQLILGACYKINSEESFRFALKYIKDASANGEPLGNKGRGMLFVALLALNQNQANVALELITSLGTSDMPITKAIYLRALAASGRLHEAIQALGRQMSYDRGLPCDVVGNCL